MVKINFTKRQWLTLFIIGLADFCNAICVSLQAPFFPQEAERKGATATEYGLVFGIFELVVFAISPFYGQYLQKIGPKKLFNTGIFTTGIAAICFGLLDHIEGHTLFVTLAFIIRIVEALGNAAFLTASFAIIAKEFPNNVGTTFASLETFFGLGLIAGPLVGSVLYSAGGYFLPFVVLGSSLFVTAVLTFLILPQHSTADANGQMGPSLRKVLRIPGVLVCTIGVCATSTSIGFLTATLEPHLRQFELGPIFVGLIFVINGGVYAISAPFIGWLVDKFVNPKISSTIGCLSIAIGFCLVGPVSFLPLEPKLSLTIIGLVLHGFGISCQLVANFSDALRTAIKSGLPDNIETYGLISGLWTSTFALGAFIGPSVSGALYDSIGFRKATIFVIAIHLTVAALTVSFMIVDRRPKPYKEVFTRASLLREARDGRLYSNSSSIDKQDVGPAAVEQGNSLTFNYLMISNNYKNKGTEWSSRCERYVQYYGSVNRILKPGSTERYGYETLS